MRARMSARRGVGSFLMGILVGILLIVLAVGGVVWWFYANFTLRKLESWTGTQIIQGETEDNVEDMALNKLIPYITGMLSDPGSLTINDLKKKFGIDIPAELSGLDLSKLFDVPFSALPDNMNLLLEDMTLKGVSELAGFTLPDIPLITGPEGIQDKPLTEAFTLLQAAIDPNTATIGSLCDNFGVTTGDNAVFTLLKDTKLSEIGTLDKKIQELKVKDIFPDSTDRIIVALGESQIGALGTAVQSLTVGDVVDVGSNKILLALKDTPLTGIGDAIPTLHLTDFVEVPAGSFLELLGDPTIDSLPSAIDNAFRTTMTIGKIAELAGVEFNVPQNVKDMKLGDFFTYVESLIHANTPAA